MEEYLDDDEKISKVNESINKTLEVFKKFKKYN
jgi:hypothetical protein